MCKRCCDGQVGEGGGRSGEEVQVPDLVLITTCRRSSVTPKNQDKCLIQKREGCSRKRETNLTIVHICIHHMPRTLPSAVCAPLNAPRENVSSPSFLFGDRVRRSSSLSHSSTSSPSSLSSSTSSSMHYRLRWALGRFFKPKNVQK